MWLNRHITKKKSDIETLSGQMQAYFDVKDLGLKKWIKRRFIERFYGSPPHAFVAALQHPSKATLIGYVIEHQHFLRQWVRSCAYIVAKTDKADVTIYELDNINTEFGGYGPEKPSHYELLIRMGESLGIDRKTILQTAALPSTTLCLQAWSQMAEREHWLETMAAMHSLELIASRNLRQDGASMHYFDPTIFDGNTITEAAKAFLREGYEADVSHSEEALDMVEKYAEELHLVEKVQSSFLKSIEIFDEYLASRLERAKQYEDIK